MAVILIMIFLFINDRRLYNLFQFLTRVIVRFRHSGLFCVYDCRLLFSHK